jgi:hypothetical protein
MICVDGCEYPDDCSASKAGYNARIDCTLSNKFVSGPSGNLYKAFEQLSTNWTAANQAVKALATRCKMKAHLVTISSEEEDVFINELARSIHGDFSLYPTSFVVGGHQNENSSDFKEPGGGWEWVNNEGPISTATHPLPNKYSNWAPKEPNDFRNQYQNPQHLAENLLTIGRFIDSTKWNDEFPGPFIRGYIVEVEVDPTVVFNTCDSMVENLRLPPLSKECPPRPISSLLKGCATYNQHDVVFDGCVEHIALKLENEGFITKEERILMINNLRGCYGI